MSPSLTTSGEEKKIISSPKADEDEKKTITTTSEEKTITATTSPKVTLKTADGGIFQVSIEVISLSQTIKHMIDDDCANGVVPLPGVDGKVLAKVIEYCQKHYKSSNENEVDEKKKDEIREWDTEFMANIQVMFAFEIVLAANHLNIKGLLDLTSQKIADDIKDKPVSYIRTLFNLENDFAPKDIDKLKKEYGDAGWNDADQ